jgi:CHAD domain-containing protein
MHDDADSATIIEVAAHVLQKRYKQLRQHGKLLNELNIEQRHLARIAGKKLRYAAEFFSSLYPSGKADTFLQKLAQLQDVLGTLNDIAVTDRLSHQLAGDHPDLIVGEALHIVSGWSACEVTHKLADMDRVWRTFAIHKPFWH